MDHELGPVSFPTTVLGEVSEFIRKKVYFMSLKLNDRPKFPLEIWTPLRYTLYV